MLAQAVTNATGALFINLSAGNLEGNLVGAKHVALQQLHFQTSPKRCASKNK